ncbi:unnamed protein product [Ceutorhynchus assimilis]|uniref:MADF domain-containing protein n=1 Tax=Ceutorhynchus assimilis TaxID=467358 RepID=A0A9N9QGR1_9CUCU|nr:unnamed protein product [Ceutorhynchus assimilis]
MDIYNFKINHLLEAELDYELKIRSIHSVKPVSDKRKMFTRLAARERVLPGSEIDMAEYVLTHSITPLKEKEGIADTMDSIETLIDAFDGDATDSVFRRVMSRLNHVRGRIQRISQVDPQDNSLKKYIQETYGECLKLEGDLHEKLAVPVQPVPDPPFYQFYLKVSTQMEFETGAGLSSLPYKFYNEKLSHIPLKETNIRLRTYSGKIVIPEGKILLTVTIQVCFGYGMSESVGVLGGSMMQCEDNPEDTAGLLLEVIQTYEFLYDLRNKEYKNNKKKEDAWKEIAFEKQFLHCFLVDHCQKLWKSLRDHYTREKREAGRSGAAAAESKWVNFSKMTFYEKYTKPRQTFTTISKPCSAASSRAASSCSTISSGTSIWSTLLSPEPQQQEESESLPVISEAEEGATNPTLEEASQDPGPSKIRQKRSILETPQSPQTSTSTSEHPKKPNKAK